MGDSDLIATLYPADSIAKFGRALDTIRLSQNSSRYVPPQVVYHDDRCSRESSLSLDGEGDQYGELEDKKIPSYFYSEGLELKFSHQRKNRVGITVGKSSACDIVIPSLGSLRSASQYQCAFTFDEKGRFVLRDLREPGLRKDGTFVTYNNRGGLKRRGFTWILSGVKFTRDKDITIAIHDNLKFQIVFASHDFQSARYRDNVALFRQPSTAKVPDLTFNSLDFHSMESTAAPSGAQTPSRDSILVDNEVLGRGGQAVVKRVWDVSTGREYACKEPLEEKYWERLKKEADLLRQISHVNIVQLVYSTVEPAPRLILEYVPLGSLHAQAKKQSISAEENLEILRQGTAALEYLHGRHEPVAHRDIKPDNILVCSRTPLHIKLSDFGFSKENLDGLRTGCGTHSYAAPEVYMGRRYDEVVDIWSLGVVVFKYAHGLPHRATEFDGVSWAAKVIRDLEEKASRRTGCLLLAFLSKAMLLFQAKNRYSARRCFAEACRLAVSPCCSSTAVPVAIPNEDERTVIYNHHEDEENDTQSISSDRPTEQDEEETITAKRATLQVSKQLRSSSPSSLSSLHGRTKRARSTTSRQPGPDSELRYFYDKYSDPLHPLYIGSSVATSDNTNSGPDKSSRNSAPRNPAEAVEVQGGSESSLLPEWLVESPPLAEPGRSRNASTPRACR